MRASHLVLSCTLAAVLGLPGILCAKVPQSQPLTRYARLWQDSPITSKPVVAAPVAGPGPFDDWALGGVSETERGALVVLLSRKTPGERRIISPADNGGYEVVQVRRDPKNYLQTEVQLRYKGQTGWVRYEEKLLAIKAPGPARGPQQPGQPNNPGRDPRAAMMEAVQQRLQGQGQGQGGERHTRERTVPTAPPSSSPSRR